MDMTVKKEVLDFEDFDIDKITQSESLPLKVIEGVQYKFRASNEIELVNANIRNALFVGASRSGKTTTFNILKDPCYCPETASMFSETQTTNFKSYSLKNNKTKEVHNFILNLIDSPGMFEIRASKDEFKTRSNDEIQKLIVECLDHEVKYLNMVVIFLAISSTVGEKDIEAIEIFRELFETSKENQNGEVPELPIVLCITHADHHNDNRLRIIEEEIKQHPRLEKFFERKNLKLLFMGCVDHKHRDYTEQMEIAKQYKRVSIWREKFINTIFESESRFDLRDTQVYQSKKGETIKNLSECIQEMKALRTTDPEGSEYKRRLHEHKPKMESIYRNKLLLDGLSGEHKQLPEDFWGMIQSIKTDAKLSEQVRSELIFPWKMTKD